MPTTKRQTTKILDLRSESDIGKQSSELFRSASRVEKAEIQSRVGSFLVEQINSFLDASNSPVKGGAFKKLKADKSLSRLLETGELRGDIVSIPEGLSKVKTGVLSSADRTERLKMFNHNIGDTLPQRQAIPLDNQTYKKSILTGIKRIIEDVVDGREN